MYSGTDQVHIFKFITMKLLGLINDTYKLYYIILRQKRGTSSTMINITGFEQNMPQGNTRQQLLNNNECQDQLIKMIKQYVLELEFHNFSKIYSFYYYFNRKRFILSR